MNYKKIPIWIYTIILSLIIVLIYKYSNRNKEKDGKIKYIILFILLLIIIQIILSYIINKKNYFKNILTKYNEIKIQKGGNNMKIMKKQNIDMKNIDMDIDIVNNMDIDTGIPEF